MRACVCLHTPPRTDHEVAGTDACLALRSALTLCFITSCAPDAWRPGYAAVWCTRARAHWSTYKRHGAMPGALIPCCRAPVLADPCPGNLTPAHAPLRLGLESLTGALDDYSFESYLGGLPGGAPCAGLHPRPRAWGLPQPPDPSVPMPSDTNPSRHSPTYQPHEPTEPTNAAQHPWLPPFHPRRGPRGRAARPAQPDGGAAEDGHAASGTRHNVAGRLAGGATRGGG